MTIQQLHYIITISETGSLNKASEILYMPFSALAEGGSAEELVKKLKGIPCKGDNSCPNQLAIAIEQNLPK